MTTSRYLGLALLASLSGIGFSLPAAAHDPVFGLGPHVLFQGGYEVHLEAMRDKAGNESSNEGAVSLAYGLTGDWAAGVETPYQYRYDNGARNQGLADTSVFTKYRFWRHDLLGVQESAAVLLKVKLNSGDNNQSPALGTGTTDTVLGLTYGYESLKWYRWAAVRYRHNGRTGAGLKRGDKILVDLVGGWRPTPPSYYKPDLVWMVELNGEFTQRADFNGASLANTGGNEWFVSPGLMWTYRNFAVKAGVQLPVASNLNGSQAKSDYRTRLELEWHL